jgi:peptide/nickel transport system ATP-binding protein
MIHLPHSDEAMLDVADLSVTFSTENGVVRAIRNVSFSLGRGEILSIVGESGSGKTVSLLSILGLVDRRTAHATGRAFFKGRDLINLSDRKMRAIRGRDIALISQDPMTALTPVQTIGFQIVEQLHAHQSLPRRSANRKAIDLLTDVGLPNPERIMDRYPHQLSGGMRQRVVIAMALSCNPSLLVADEPTTALDVTVQAQILELLKRLQKDHGSSIVLITHDMGVVREMADRVAVMYGGEIIEQGTAEQVLNDPWHPYTWGLMASIPPLYGERPKRLFSIPGTPPAPGQVGEGCAFFDRCRFRSESCLAKLPLQSADGRSVLCVLSGSTRQEMRSVVLGHRQENLNATV